MTPEIVRAHVQLRRAIRELESAVQPLERARIAGVELPDVDLELKRLQEVMQQVQNVQRQAQVQGQILGLLLSKSSMFDEPVSSDQTADNIGAEEKVVDGRVAEN